MCFSVQSLRHLRKADIGVLLFGVAVAAYLAWGGYFELLAISVVFVGLYYWSQAHRERGGQVQCMNCGFDLTIAVRSEKSACPRCGAGLES